MIYVTYINTYSIFFNMYYCFISPVCAVTMIIGVSFGIFVTVKYNDDLNQKNTE